MGDKSNAGGHEKVSEILQIGSKRRSDWGSLDTLRTNLGPTTTPFFPPPPFFLLSPLDKADNWWVWLDDRSPFGCPHTLSDVSADIWCVHFDARHW